MIDRRAQTVHVDPSTLPLLEERVKAWRSFDGGLGFEEYSSWIMARGAKPKLATMHDAVASMLATLERTKR